MEHGVRMGSTYTAYIQERKKERHKRDETYDDDARPVDMARLTTMYVSLRIRSITTKQWQHN